MDIALFNQMGEEFKKRFEGKNINKIVTIEASGIGIACVVAMHFNVPVVFAKKSKSINIEGGHVHSRGGVLHTQMQESGNYFKEVFK